MGLRRHSLNVRVCLTRNNCTSGSDMIVPSATVMCSILSKKIENLVISNKRETHPLYDITSFPKARFVRLTHGHSIRFTICWSLATSFHLVNLFVFQKAPSYSRDLKGKYPSVFSAQVSTLPRRMSCTSKAWMYSWSKLTTCDVSSNTPG